MKLNPFRKRADNKGKVQKFIPSGFNTYFLGNNTPTWINTQNLKAYEKIITTNPVVFSAIDILARYFANGKVKIKDLKTGEIYSKDELIAYDIKNKSIVEKAFNLFDRPNPLQSRWEFLRTYIFFKKTFGNTFTYGNSGNANKFSIENVAAIWNLWPQYMNVVLKGNYFAATDINEIIKSWQFGYLGNKRTTYTADEILHRKEVNVQLTDTNDLIFGTSILKSLKMPISNINKEYESINVILENRGARLVISPEQAGADQFNTGEPLEEDDKKELQDDFSDYGFLGGQKPNLVTKWPINVTQIDQDIRKLGIFEAIANDTLAIAHGLGVNELLIKMYIQGATFENQKEASKQTYQDTVIPEFNDFIEDFNNWLKIPDYGFKLISTFEHVPVLQEDFKERATANSFISRQYSDQFMKGACTWNEWRRALGQKEEDWGDMRIFDLPSEMQKALGISVDAKIQNN